MAGDAKGTCLYAFLLCDIYLTLPWGLAEPKLIYHMYPFVQRMVARASASVFVGLDLCKDDELVTVFQNLTTDIGSTLRVASWLERFTTLMRLRMW